MNSVAVQVVVIGGGATGVSTALALASLGVRTALVERRDFAAGTSGRNHGLLHSGARYAVKDPAAALECWPENQRVRRLFPEVVDPCGGLFVALSEEEEAYLEELRRSLEVLGIPSGRLDGRAARQLEPALSPAVRAALTVPDGAVDPFRLVYAIASWAAAEGALLFPGHEVVALHAPSGRGGRWRVELKTGVSLTADAVIDAAGPWVAQVAGLAGVKVPLVLSAGSLLVYQSRPTRRVINRARPPADGDILVPGGPVLVAGTTARFLPPDNPALLDPPGLRVDAAEVRLLRAEAEALLPVLKELRLLRAFAGVRALAGPVEPAPAEGPAHGAGQGQARGESEGQGRGQDATQGRWTQPAARAQTRDFRVFAPAELGAPEGFFAVVGGKLTTSLLMGEATARRVAPLFGIAVPATPWLGQDGWRTGRLHRKRLSGSQRRRSFTVPVPGRPWWDRRRAQHGGSQGDRSIICECEWVSRDELVAELAASFTRDGFAGARRRLRLGMGGCQGTHCSLALPGIAWEAISGGTDAVERIWDAWAAFVRSRFAGVAALGIRGLIPGPGRASARVPQVEETLRRAIEQAEEAYFVYTELFGLPPEQYGFAVDGWPDPDGLAAKLKQSDGTEIAG
ncbi:MAG: FAD-dependent oxidoreductase [Limnochordales bacterium]|nr:FAD-dependent oxidoreductase [Limnochordales bacterium]